MSDVPPFGIPEPAFPSSGTSATFPPTSVAQLDERFRGVIETAQQQVADGVRPSIQLAVDWRGECVVNAAVGAGATPESLYVLWSTTKPFVAVTLLQLIEAGRAALDDRVSKFLPEFDQGGKGEATLAHVLSHRGGFPATLPEQERELAALQRDWDAALEYVCALPALWKPGTDRGYHPRSGWFVLGEIIQRLDDRPLAESVSARVLDPLEIPRDAFSLGTPQALAHPPLPVHTQAVRGSPKESEARFWSDPATHAAVLPGAGAISCAKEVGRFFRALLDARLDDTDRRPGRSQPDSRRVLSPQMVRCATFPHAVGIRDRTFLTDVPWGLGFHLKHVRPSLDDCGDTATPGTFGHGGHFLVHTAWADPGRDLVFCTLANGLTPSRAGRNAVNRLSQAVHDAVDRALQGR